MQKIESSDRRRAIANAKSLITVERLYGRSRGALRSHRASGAQYLSQARSRPRTTAPSRD